VGVEEPRRSVPCPCCVKAFSARTDHKNLWTAGALACALKNCASATPTHFAPRAIKKSKLQGKPVPRDMPSRAAAQIKWGKAFTIAGAQARELLRCSGGLSKSSIIQPVPRLFSTPRKSRVPHPSRSWLSEAWDSTRYPLTFSDLAGCDEGKAACSNASPEHPNPNAAALESRASTCPILSRSAPKKHGTTVGVFFVFSIT
jgi:hypothetical protein